MNVSCYKHHTHIKLVGVTCSVVCMRNRVVISRCAVLFMRSQNEDINNYNNYIYIKQHQNHHTNILPAFYIPFKIGDSNCFAPSCFCSLKTRYVTVLTPTKPSCFHRFFNIGLLPERLWSCSFGF